MINRLLDFLNASPVNFLAAKIIASYLEQAGYRRLDPQMPIGEVKAGDKLYVTKNDSSVYAFHIGRLPLTDAGFRMICAHCDSPTFRIKPNAEMTCEGGIVKLNTEVYGGPIMSTWFDRPLTIAGRVIVRGEDALHPKTLLLHVKRPLLQISNLAIHFNREVNDGVKLSKRETEQAEGYAAHTGSRHQRVGTWQSADERHLRRTEHQAGGHPRLRPLSGRCHTSLYLRRA